MNQDYYPSDLYGPMFVFLAAIWIIALMVGIAIYLLQATAYFKMFKKANIAHAWLAYIPIGQIWPFFWTIRKSAWNILWCFLPVAAGIVGGILMGIMQNSGGSVLFIILIAASTIWLIILGILWQIRFFKAFGMNPLWLLGLIGLIIPVINFFINVGFLVLYCYMGFSKEVHYHPENLE